MPEVAVLLGHAGLSATGEAIAFGFAAVVIVALFLNDRRRRKADDG